MEPYQFVVLKHANITPPPSIFNDVINQNEVTMRIHMPYARKGEMARPFDELSLLSYSEVESRKT